MGMLERIKALQERNDAEGQSRRSNQNIFLRLEEGSHRLRLVGEYVEIHSHWIAPSKFNKAKLFPESAFEGEDALKKNTNCCDFDFDTELVRKEKTCTICQLREAVNAILRDTRNPLTKEQENFLIDVSKAAKPRHRFFFHCIDRDDKENACIKILEVPEKFIDVFSEALNNYGEQIITEDNGIDLNISMKKGAKDTTYTINPVIDKITGSLKKTPLTNEEKRMEFPDIKKIMGRMPDQGKLFDNLLPQLRELVSDWRQENGVVATPSVKEEAEEMVPF